MLENTLTQSKTKLQKVFDLFTSNDPLKPVFHKPFVHQGLLCATDSHSMIYCDESLGDFEVEVPLACPDIRGVIPEVNCNRLLITSREALAPLKTRPVFTTNGVPEFIECRHCNGEGQVDWEFDHYTKEGDCPYCQGQGETENNLFQKIATGEFEYEGVVLVSGCIFKASLFARLFSVQSEFGTDIRMLSHNGIQKGTLFFVDPVHVLIMPMLTHNEEKEKVITAQFTP